MVKPCVSGLDSTSWQSPCHPLLPRAVCGAWQSTPSGKCGSCCADLVELALRVFTTYSCLRARNGALAECQILELSRRPDGRCESYS